MSRNVSFACRRMAPKPAAILAQKLLGVVDFYPIQVISSEAYKVFGAEGVEIPAVTISGIEVPQPFAFDNARRTFIALSPDEMNGDFELFAQTPIYHAKMPKEYKLTRGLQYLECVKTSPFVAAHMAKLANDAMESLDSPLKKSFFEENPYDGYEEWESTIETVRNAGVELSKFSALSLDFLNKHGKDMDEAIKAAVAQTNPPESIMGMDFSDIYAGKFRHSPSTRQRWRN